MYLFLIIKINYLLNYRFNLIILAQQNMYESQILL